MDTHLKDHGEGWELQKAGLSGRKDVYCLVLYLLSLTHGHYQATNSALRYPSAMVLCVTPGLETTELGDYGLIQQTKRILLPLSCSSQDFFSQ